MSAILGFLGALPQIISLVNEIWAFLKKISNGDPADFVVKLGAAFNQLNAAQTKEDYAKSAKDIADLISHLPK